MELNFKNILLDIENNIGKPGRKFSFIDKLTWLKLDKPQWNWKDDDIAILINNWHRVFKEGKLTWGHIIQANVLMFEPGKANCPAEVLLWLDSLDRFDIDEFESMADELYELKGESDILEDKDEKEYAEHLEDEMERNFGSNIPHSISQGYNVKSSVIYCQRKHIPNGVLNVSILPMLYLNENPMLTVIVPQKFWSKEYLELWM